MTVDPRAFGPKAGLTDDARTGLGLAKIANSGADLIGAGVPYGGTALSLANLGLDLAQHPSEAGGTLTRAGIGDIAAGGPLTQTALNAAGVLDKVQLPALYSGSLLQGTAAPAGGLVLAGWALPQLADTLSNLIEGNEAGVRRAGRTRDAMQLGGDIVGAFQPGRGLSSVFATPTGGSTVGDALASMLKYNLNGTWYADTSHNWLPDPALRPLQRLLTSAGYTGATEPHRGNVGGVGEIVAGSGDRLVPPDIAAMLEAQYKERLGAGPSSGREDWETPTGTIGGYFDAPLGALGWDLGLRGLVSRLTGTPLSGTTVEAPTPTGAYPGQMVKTPDNYGGTATTLVPPSLSPDYLNSLEDPDLAAKIAAAFKLKHDSEQVVADAYHNAP